MRLAKAERALVQHSGMSNVLRDQLFVVGLIFQTCRLGSVGYKVDYIDALHRPAVKKGSNIFAQHSALNVIPSLICFMKKSRAF